MIKKGFTLSEALITLVVLGIIAAVLVPAITKQAPDKNKIMFRKAYNTLQQAVSVLINDDANYPSTQTIQIPASTGIYYQKGFNYTTQASGTNLKFCSLLSDLMNTTISANCPATNATGQIPFTTSDGITWTLYIPVSDDTNTTETATTAVTTGVQFPISSSLYTTKIIIDIDGNTKGTNCSTDTGFAAPYKPTAGTPSPAYADYAPTTRCVNTGVDSATNPCKFKPDTFIIGVRYDGKLQVGSGNNTDNCAMNILSNPTENR